MHNTQNNFDLIMFDLDGTLVETALEIGDAVNDALRRFDWPQVSQQQVKDWMGLGTHELLIQALAFSSARSASVVRASADLARLEGEFAPHYHARCGTRSQLYPQVRETLTALQAQGVKLALVTNKEAKFTQTVLNAHGLRPLLDCVISGDTLPTKKPHPAGIAYCLALFGVAQHRALFVGDSRIDVAAARNAGVAAWVLPYGYNRGEAIEACTPDRVIFDCSALLN